MRIAVYPADAGGCGHYRLIWPAEAIARKYPDVEVLIGKDAPTIKVAWSEEFKDDPNGMAPYWVQAVDADVDADVVVMQRPLHRQFTQVYEILRRKGVRVCVDLDDNFDRVDTKNIAYFATQPNWVTKAELEQWIEHMRRDELVTKKSWDKNWFHTPHYEGCVHGANIRRALEHADMLTVSTPHLLQHYGRIPAAAQLIRNTLPPHALKLGQEKIDTPHEGPVRVGWTGSVQTHPQDLEEIGGAMLELRRRVNFELHIVGLGTGIFEKWGVSPDTHSGWKPISEYHLAYQHLDVALCPLHDDQFNHSKSWLKPLEAAGVGAVPVLSPTPEYRVINDMGIGVIAKRPREWVSKVARLIEDAEHRRDLQVAGYATAMKHGTDEYAKIWFQAWTGKEQS